MQLPIELLNEPPCLCGPRGGMLCGVDKAVRCLHAKIEWECALALTCTASKISPDVGPSDVDP